MVDYVLGILDINKINIYVCMDAYMECIQIYIYIYIYPDVFYSNVTSEKNI